MSNMWIIKRMAADGYTRVVGDPAAWRPIAADEAEAAHRAGCDVIGATVISRMYPSRRGSCNFAGHVWSSDGVWTVIGDQSGSGSVRVTHTYDPASAGNFEWFARPGGVIAANRPAGEFQRIADGYHQRRRSYLASHLSQVRRPLTQPGWRFGMTDEQIAGRIAKAEAELAAFDAEHPEIAGN